MYTDYTDENTENEYYEENNNNGKEKIKKIAFFVIAFVVVLVLIIVLAKACSNSGGRGSGNGDNFDISVAINRESVSLEVGETFELFADVLAASTENPEIFWLSEDSSVVTIEDGMLTAINEGETNVVANYIEDEIIYSAKCKVIVTSKAVEVESIDIVQEKIAMKPNDTVLLQINVFPEEAKLADLVFTSDDSTIASVSKDGYVNGISVGTTSIKVETQDGRLSDTITVVVNKNGSLTIEPVSLELIGISSGLTVGGTTNIIYELSPSNATDTELRWYSTDTSVATVENGVVRGIRAGTCKIVATTSNNISSELEITVESSDIPVESVVIDGDISFEMKVNGTKILRYIISPSNATNKKVRFTSSNTNVVYVDSNGIVVAVGKGSAVVTITTEDGNKTAIANITVTETGGTQTGNNTSGSSSSSGSTSTGSGSSSSSGSTVGSGSGSSSSFSGSSSCSASDFVSITHDGKDQGAIISAIQWSNVTPFTKNARVTIETVKSCIKDGRFSYKLYKGTNSSNVTTLNGSGNNLVQGSIISINGNGYYNLKITGTTLNGDTLTKTYYIIINTPTVKYTAKYYDQNNNIYYIDFSENKLSSTNVIRYCLSSTTCTPTTSSTAITSSTTYGIRNVVKGQKVCMAMFIDGVKSTDVVCTSATTAPALTVSHSFINNKMNFVPSLTSSGSGNAKMYYCVNSTASKCEITTSSPGVNSGDTRSWQYGSGVITKYVCFQAIDAKGNKSIKKCYDLVNKKAVA